MQPAWGGEIPDPRSGPGPVEPQADAPAAAPGAVPAQTSPGSLPRPTANQRGAGRVLLLLLEMFAVTCLCVVGVMHVAPAARVGYSWASNNLRLLQLWITTCCPVPACADLLLGQAQLVVRGVSAARSRPTRRYPATYILRNTIRDYSITLHCKRISSLILYSKHLYITANNLWFSCRQYTTNFLFCDY